VLQQFEISNILTTCTTISNSFKNYNVAN